MQCQPGCHCYTKLTFCASLLLCLRFMLLLHPLQHQGHSGGARGAAGRRDGVDGTRPGNGDACAAGCHGQPANRDRHEQMDVILLL